MKEGLVDRECPAIAQPWQIAIFEASSFWMSHNGRMWSGRFLRVCSPRDPLFFGIDFGLLGSGRGEGARSGDKLRAKREWYQRSTLSGQIPNRASSRSSSLPRV